MKGIKSKITYKTLNIHIQNHPVEDNNTKQNLNIYAASGAKTRQAPFLKKREKRI